MVEQAEDVLRLHERCNILGLDTISAGNLVALAIRAGQSGRLEDAPRPGEVPAIAALLDAIARRSTPLGDLLADGIRNAGERLNMADETVHVKGMEPAGYDPRALRGMALAYATSPRGACHLRATFYKPILSGMTKDLDPAGVAALFVDFEDRLFLFDCLTMCRFYRDFLTWDDLLVATSELAGRPVSREEVQRLIGDLHTRIRRLNFAMGLTAADDTLPLRFLTEGLDGREPVGREELGELLREYWLLRGWGEDGSAVQGDDPQRRTALVGSPYGSARRWSSGPWEGHRRRDTLSSTGTPVRDKGLRRDGPHDGQRLAHTYRAGDTAPTDQPSAPPRRAGDQPQSLGRQHLARDAHRAVEGARRPGWIRRHGWLSH